MNSFRMKALSLAVLGLAGFGMAGSAFAVCPTDPAVAGGGAWSTKVQTGGTVAISSPGYASTACKLDATLTLNNAFDQATVVDQSPQNEPTYRARFYVNTDDLTAAGAFDGVIIFSANAAASFPAVNPTLQILRLSLIGGGATGRQLGIIAACNNGGGNTCSVAAPLPATGTSTVEVQIIMGANGVGAVNYWINNNVSGTPTGSVTITGGNAGWVGTKEARMGMAGPTLGFRTNHLNQPLHFDEFDSRRQTFIGF